MAALENRIIQIKNDPETINSVNNIMSCFGWTLVNVQVTHSQNTKTYTSAFDYYLRGNQTQTVETTTINYATITYQRSRGLTHYEEIVALEEEYNRLTEEIQEISNSDAKQVGISALMILFALLFPPYLIYLLVTGRNRKNISNLDKSLGDSAAKIKKLQDKCDRTLNEAASLVD